MNAIHIISNVEHTPIKLVTFNKTTKLHTVSSKDSPILKNKHFFLLLSNEKENK